MTNKAEEKPSEVNSKTSRINIKYVGRSAYSKNRNNKEKRK